MVDGYCAAWSALHSGSAVSADQPPAAIYLPLEQAPTDVYVEVAMRQCHAVLVSGGETRLVGGLVAMMSRVFGRLPCSEGERS